MIEKETALFFCNASGNPAPSVTWVRSNGGTIVGSGNTLRFDTAWRYQSGRYWCKADNGLNVTIEGSAYLNVQCKYYHTEIKGKLHKILMMYYRRYLFTYSQNR